MSITMKPLKDFRGRVGEGNTRQDDRMVVIGPEFKVANQSRTNDLESRGLAVPVVAKLAAKPAVKMDQKPLNKMEPAPENKAANTGPLALAGGEIGPETAPSSSQAARAPRKRRSKKPAAERTSLL